MRKGKDTTIPANDLQVTEPASGVVATFWLRRCATIAAIFCMCMSIAVLLGWQFHLTALTTVIPGLPKMTPNTAVSLLLAGLALLLLRSPQKTARMQALARAAAILLLVLGVATSLEYLIGRDFGIDQLLFLDTSSVQFPGRPSPRTAVTICLVALALLSIDWETRSGFRPAELAAGAGALIALAALVGYTYRTAFLYQAIPGVGMALHTSIGFLAISLGVVCARPDRGWMSIVFGDTTGGYLARRLCPAALLVPFAIGAARVLDQREGVFGVTAASAAVTNMTLALALVLWMARSLHRMDLSSRRSAREILELNKNLEAHARELETSNKELEAFTYAVSDDLRAPLRAIDAFSATLAEDYDDRLDEVGKSRLQRIRAGCRRMSQLIDDMLALSHLTRHEMKLESVDLAKIVRSVADQLSRAHPDRRIKFSALDAIEVDADRTLIRVAVENLLDNAWKFTQFQHEARVAFGVCTINAETVFFVEDNGAGFDMAYVDKLFGAFQRLHDQTFPGTGIGLATVQRVVHRHGGRVWAEGTVGEGATFYFTLPKAAESAGSTPIGRERTPDPAPIFEVTPRIGGMRR